MPFPSNEVLGQSPRPVPLVLVIGGLSPSGAGLQADIETCRAFGCHPLPVATAVTVQSTRGLMRAVPLNAEDVRDQLLKIIDDVAPIASCKVGMVPNAEIATVLREVLAALPESATRVVDPVLAASAGGALTNEALQSMLPSLILSQADVIKPNQQEACRLADTDDPRIAGERLSRLGRCRYALLTGADTDLGSNVVTHTLYRDGALYAEYTWPRRPGAFHGTGCTLSSAIASCRALGQTMERAVASAQDFTWQAVRYARDIGGAQLIPERDSNHARRWLQDA